VGATRLSNFTKSALLLSNKQKQPETSFHHYPPLDQTMSGRFRNAEKLSEHMAWVRSHRTSITSSSKKKKKNKTQTKQAQPQVQAQPQPLRASLGRSSVRAHSITDMVYAAAGKVKAAHDHVIQSGKTRVEEYLSERQRQATVDQVHAHSAQRNPDVRRAIAARIDEDHHDDAFGEANVDDNVVASDGLDDVVQMLQKNHIARTARTTSSKKKQKKNKQQNNQNSAPSKHLTWRNQSNDDEVDNAGIADVRIIPAREQTTRD